MDNPIRQYNIMTIRTEDYLAVSYSAADFGWYVEAPSNSYMMIFGVDNNPEFDLKKSLLSVQILIAVTVMVRVFGMAI